MQQPQTQKSAPAASLVPADARVVSLYERLLARARRGCIAEGNEVLARSREAAAGFVWCSTVDGAWGELELDGASVGRVVGDAFDVVYCEI